MKARRIIINRTDNIGDVILTLPMAKAIKDHFPETEVLFLGKPYTLPLINHNIYIDKYLNWEEVRKDPQILRDTGADLIIHVFNNREVAELAKKVGIRYRLGTSHRIYNIWTCNRFVHFGRSKSDLHEAQLNLKMLTPLGIRKDYTREEVGRMYGWKDGKPDRSRFAGWLVPDKFNLIMHMKSFGNAKEWKSEYFFQLAQELDADLFNIILTGTDKEGEMIRNEVPDIFNLKHTIDATGKFDIAEFFDFVQCVDGLLACSTGPLHIAAATGVRALGLYPSARPKHAGRWGPLGPNVDYIEDNSPMEAPLNISVDQVRERLFQWIRPKQK